MAARSKEEDEVLRLRLLAAMKADAARSNTEDGGSKWGTGCTITAVVLVLAIVVGMVMSGSSNTNAGSVAKPVATPGTTGVGVKTNAGSVATPGTTTTDAVPEYEGVDMAVNEGADVGVYDADVGVGVYEGADVGVYESAGVDVNEGADVGVNEGADVGVVASASSDNVAANFVTPNNAASTPVPISTRSAPYAADYAALTEVQVAFVFEALKKEVFGQPDAILSVIHQLRKWDGKSPLVLFLDGSTQVGKTLLAVTLQKALVAANVSVPSGTLMVSLKQGILQNITTHIALTLDAAAAVPTRSVACIYFDEVQDLKTEEEIHAALPFFARLIHPTAPYVEDTEGVRHNASRAIIVVSGHLSSDAVQNLWSQVEKDYGKNAAVLVEQLGLQMDRLRERTFKPWSSVMPMGRDPQQYMQFITLHPFGVSELRSIVVPMVQQRLNTSAEAEGASSLPVMNADMTMRRAFADIVGDGAMHLELSDNAIDFLVSNDSIAYKVEPNKPLWCAAHKSLLTAPGYNPPRCAMSRDGAVAVENALTNLLECAGINDETMVVHIRTYLLDAMVLEKQVWLNRNRKPFSEVNVHSMHITWGLQLVEPVNQEYSLSLTALVTVDKWLIDGKVVGGGADVDRKPFTIATDLKHLKAAVGTGGCSAAFAEGIRRLAAHRR